MTRSKLPRERLVLVLPLMVVWLLALAMLLNATEADAQPTQRQTGWLTLLYGDPQPGSLLPARLEIALQDAKGSTLARLAMADHLARPFYGQQVEVSGSLLDSGQTTGLPPLLSVTTVRSLEPDSASASIQTSGSQPWVNVLCKFADVSSTPRSPAYFELMFASTYKGLNHYWQQMSYNQINLDGSVTTSRWYTLPHPRSYYIAGGTYGANLNLLADDCAAAVDAEIFFPNFVGINFVFNEMLDCCAWGGGRSMTLDGQRRFYRTTWLPPWAQRHDIIGHEMGHGFGMPHSTGPASDPPNELNVYVSQWDVMSMAGGTCRLRDDASTYCLSQGIIAYHRALAGWLPPERVTLIPSHSIATVTLDRLIDPGTTSNPLMAQIIMDGAYNRFYTVEVRDLVAYDQNIPARAVVIHDVDTYRLGNGGLAYLVDDDDNTNVNDEGAIWRVGETYYDAARHIRIDILSETDDSFVIAINNNAALVSGIVTDADLNALPDVEVLALAPGDTEATATTVSAADGVYTLALSPGLYRLVARAPGYSPTVYNNDDPLTVPDRAALTGINFVLTPMQPAVNNLLTNPGFEDAAGNPNLPLGWTAVNLNRDRRICATPSGLPRAYSGNCAFQFNGVPGVSSRLHQRVWPEAQAGDWLRLSAWVEGRNTRGAAIFAVIQYQDGHVQQLHLDPAALNATYNYQQLTAERRLRGPVRLVRIVLRSANGNGRLRVDDVTLSLHAGPSALTAPLLALPAAPAEAGLRGQE